MLTTYDLDGTQTRFTFDWPYLDRSHIMVTVDLAARPFKFINDHEVEVKSIFGDPLPEGRLKIFRVTPDLISLAEFKDAANLSALDLNRARLQCLFLIQERSGGIAGSVGAAIQLVTNEIETLSGALDTIAVTQGVLTAGLQTLDDLNAQIVVAVNEASALRDKLDQEIIDRAAEILQINQRVQTVEVAQGNLGAQVTQQVTTLLMANQAQASRTDGLEARIDTVDDFDEVTDRIAASLIATSVAQAKGDSALAKSIVTLEASMNENVNALIQEEREARVTADEATAHQILTLQARIDDDLAQIVEDISVTVDRVNGVSAQWTMKAIAQRGDGTPVFAGIGLAATANNEISKSEIVMQADRLVFVAADALEAAPKPIMMAGLVDGSPSLVIPSNTMGDRTYPGRILVDGSIEGRSVAAETITGDLLKAGTITTREIDVSLGVNLLPASSFVDGLTGWSLGGNIGTAAAGLDLAGWTLAGGHTANVNQQDGNYAGQADRYSDLFSDMFSVTAGERYEFSAYTGAHRCTVRCVLSFWNEGGGFVGEAVSTDNASEMMGGEKLSSHKRLYGFGTAPATAAYARLIVRKFATNPGESTSWLFVTQPFVGTATPNQTRPGPWGPSGLGTRITPAGISTPYLSALSADMGHITAGHLDVGTVFAGYIRADRVDIIDTLMVRGGAITLGLQASGNNYASLWHSVPAGQTHSIMLVASFGTSQEIPFGVLIQYPGDHNTATSTATVTGAVANDVQTPATRDPAQGLGQAGVMYSYKSRTMVAAFTRGEGSHEFIARVDYVFANFNTPVTLIAYVFKR